MVFINNVCLLTLKQISETQLFFPGLYVIFQVNIKCFCNSVNVIKISYNLHCIMNSRMRES